MTNPYSAPATTAMVHQTKPRWRLWFLLLNGILIAIPKLLLLGTYLWISIGAEEEQNSLAGDPVLFQHYVWVEVEVWPAVAYFLIPNGILLGMFIYWLKSRRRSND